jgi:hypothetical protein
MEASGQINILATLLPGKEPTVPFEMDVRWTPQPVRTFWRREEFLVPAVRPIAQSMHRYTEHAIPALDMGPTGHFILIDSRKLWTSSSDRHTFLPNSQQTKSKSPLMRHSNRGGKDIQMRLG